jgi:hypothetical protein
MMSKFNDIKKEIADLNPDALLADGLESALIGYARVHDEIVACYDEGRAIKALMRQGMSEEDAIEHFEYNTIRSLPYMGDDAPVFIRRL